jgi:hypothetical protein
VISLPYEPSDCFTARQPVVIPAKTLLSQVP